MNYIKTAISLLCTLLIYLIGDFDIALQTLLLFIVLDYITGLLKAWKKENLSSKKGIQGIIKKLGLLSLVVLVTALDRNIGDYGLIRTPVLYFMVVNEGISICENLGSIGVPIPKIIIDKLEQLNSTINKEE